MVSIQAVLTPGKKEFFKGIQYTPKGHAFLRLRGNLGSKDNPKWHEVSVFGSEAQLEATLQALTKPDGSFTSLLVKAPARPRMYIAPTVNPETGEVTGQKEVLAFTTNFDKLSLWDNAQKAWVEAHQLLDKK
jgi:hypothetical protein